MNATKFALDAWNSLPVFAQASGCYNEIRTGPGGQLWELVSKGSFVRAIPISKAGYLALSTYKVPADQRCRLEEM